MSNFPSILKIHIKIHSFTFFKDVPSELNRNLTNWGMTYKAGKSSRKTWDNSTFVREMQQREAAMSEEVPVVTVDPQSGVVFSYSPQPSPNRPPSYPSIGGGSSPSPTSLAQGVQQQQLPQGFEINFAEPKNLKRANRLSFGGRGDVPVSVSDSGASRSSESPKPSPAAAPIQSRKSTEKEQSPGIGFIVGEGPSAAAEIKKREMGHKREQLIANAMRRREQQELKREKAEKETDKRKDAEQKKQEEAERRKIEKEIHRQKVLEEYQKKKAEQESKEHQLHSGAFPPTSPSSATTSGASTPRSTRLVRGQSQPPRPKSQVVGASSRSANNVGESDVIGIIHKLRDICNQVAGHEFAKSESKHFLLLFRDKKCQYRGLYCWDEQSDTVHRLHGSGPKVCNEKMMDLMFKYDSGAKQFSNIPTRHLSATIDGFTIKDEFWQKKKPMYAKR